MYVSVFFLRFWRAAKSILLIKHIAMSAHHILSRHSGARTFLSFLFVVLVSGIVILTPHITFAAEGLPEGVLERHTCGTTQVDIYGYGAGLMHNAQPIVAYNVQLTTVNNTENCAVLHWDTVHPAATQVVFARADTEPVSIDLAAENFGYPHATVQNNAGIASHTAILEGLEPGVAYSYRVVTRSHPSALPNISDARIFVAGTVAPVVVSPIAPHTPSVPTTSVPSAPVVEQPIVAPTETEPQETPAVTKTELETPTVPSALTAAQQALGNTRESAFLAGIATFFSQLMPERERLSLTSTIGLFKADTYIVPVLFFLVLVFLLQQIVLPAFNVSLKDPLLYWLFGSMVLAILAAVFMLYYVSLVGIAIFLGALARYLMQSTPDETAATEVKLLETADHKKEKVSTQAGSHK